MRDIVDLIDQEDVWVDGDGVEHSIAGLDPVHCLNITRFLTRRAAGIARADTLAMLSVPMPDVHSQAFVDVDRSMATDEALKVADPVGWLNETPLMAALKARAAAGGNER